MTAVIGIGFLTVGASDVYSQPASGGTVQNPGGTVQNPGGTVQNPGGTVQNPGGTVQNPGAPAGGTSVLNPLKVTTLEGFLLAIIDILLIFAIPIMVFFIIFAGFKLVTARGNEEQISSARTMLTWAIIGAVIIIGARAIVDIVKNTITAI